MEAEDSVATRMGRIEDLLESLMTVGGEPNEAGATQGPDLGTGNARKSLSGGAGAPPGAALEPFSPFTRPRDRLSTLENKMDKILAALTRDGRLGEFEA